MADYPWNHTYVEGDEWNSPKAYRTFAKAWSERLKAIRQVPYSNDPTVQGGVPALLHHYADGDSSNPVGGPTYIGILTGTTPYAADFTDDLGNTVSVTDLEPFDVSFTPAVSDSVLIIEFPIDGVIIFPADVGSRWSWPNLIDSIVQLSRFYVDRDAATPEGQSCLLPLGVFDWTPPTLFDRAAWPGSFGWTRKVERPIYAVADSGTDGQRARYCWFSASHVHPITDVFLGFSPADERKYSTKFFDNVAGTWVLSADQTSDADIVTLYGIPRPGDLMGPWILNDIQSAINDLTWTWVRATDLSPPQPTFATISWNLADTSDASWNPNSPFYGGDGSDDRAPAIAAAEAAFPGVTGPYTFQDPYGTRVTGGVWYQVVTTSYLSFPTVNWTAYIQISPIKPSLVGVPNFCTRTVLFYVGATFEPGDFGPLFDGSFNGLAVTGDGYSIEFDANGTGLLEGQFHLTETISSTTALQVDGVVPVGDGTTVPTQPTGDGTTHEGYRGFVTQDILAIIKWDGFVYHA